MFELDGMENAYPYFLFGFSDDNCFAGVYAYVRDADHFPGGNWPIDYTVPLVTVSMTHHGGYGTICADPGFGWWGPYGRVGGYRGTLVAIGSVFGWGSIAGPRPLTKSWACLAEIRPDLIRGVVTVQMRADGDPLQARHYDNLTLNVPLEFLVSNHGGRVTDLSNTSNIPAGTNNGWFEYGAYDEGLYYENLWPWESITDPAIRSAVYWRYTPYNDPRYAKAAAELGIDL